MKSKITKSEYLQLLGLFTIADQHQKVCDDAGKSASEIIGEDYTDGSISDAMWGDSGEVSTRVDEMLRRAKITVKKG